MTEKLGYFREHDNVIDFIEYYVQQLAEKYAKSGQADIANALYDALDSYLSHEAMIQLIDGQVYLLPMDIIEENPEENNA